MDPLALIDRVNPQRKIRHDKGPAQHSLHNRVLREPVRREHPCSPRDVHTEGEQPEEAAGPKDTVFGGHHIALALGTACAGCGGGRARGVMC